MNGFTRDQSGHWRYYVNGRVLTGWADLTYQTGAWWYFEPGTGIWTGWIWLNGTLYYWNGSQWVRG